jgi:hypothetical protein
MFPPFREFDHLLPPRWHRRVWAYSTPLEGVSICFHAARQWYTWSSLSRTVRCRKKDCLIKLPPCELHANSSTRSFVSYVVKKKNRTRRMSHLASDNSQTKTHTPRMSVKDQYPIHNPLDSSHHNSHQRATRPERWSMVRYKSISDLVLFPSLSLHFLLP